MLSHTFEHLSYILKIKAQKLQTQMGNLQYFLKKLLQKGNVQNLMLAHLIKSMVPDQHNLCDFHMLQEHHTRL